ncbi:MAG: DUF349 domain-containing protein [Acidobacteriota bacterium]
MRLLDRFRPHPGWKDPDPSVRREAVSGLTDPSLLAGIARTDPDERVREEAADALLGIALESEEEAKGLEALAALTGPKRILAVARSASCEAVSRAALGRLADARALGSVARHAEHAACRLEALEAVRDQAELGMVALKSPYSEVALAALERLEDPALLETVAQRARCRAAAHRARTMLRGGDGTAGAPRPGPRRTDRGPQIDLCRTIEMLARAEGTKRLAAQISAAKDAWTDLLPDVDDDLEDRFNAGYRAARERLADNRARLAEARRREEEAAAYHAEHLAPRLALCEKVESATGDLARRALDDARWEWERLTPEEGEEVRALSRRFEEACRDCQARHEAWERKRSEAERSAAERARREKQERARRKNCSRLKELCERLERLLASDSLTLRQAERGAREVRAALQDPDPLPGPRERRRIVARLKAVHAALSPRLQELRDSDRWMRWANAGVQETLCARAEALVRLHDPPSAARQLYDLQQRWKTASRASRDRSLALWTRFKAAQDAIRARLEAYQADRAREKEALCVRAEALATSTDWIGTSEALKALQAEWKGVGPTARGREKELWERFRSACDRFFGRRKADLAERRAEWVTNLEAKEALCARAEALAESRQWRETAEQIKRLQAKWRKIGPVGRKHSERIWRRFHAACDRFFDRYKRRDRIDLEASVEQRAALCREVEAMEPPADPAALLALWKRWRLSPALPPRHAVPLGERFNAALGRLVAASPEAYRGSDLDAARNRRRMEELCARAERLVADGQAAPDGGASPGTRLAAMLVEALASNTIGGRAGAETRRRSAAEEMKRLQAAWQRVGYVPEDVRGDLSERFEGACRRFAERGRGDRPTTTSSSRASRS